MYGPEKGNCQNSSVFETIKPNELISWKRISQPLFNITISFDKITNLKTKITLKNDLRNCRSVQQNPTFCPTQK